MATPTKLVPPLSVCTVVSAEFLKEFTVFAKTFRLFNPTIPIVVAASQEDGSAAVLDSHPPVEGVEVATQFSEVELAKVRTLGKMPERMKEVGSHPRDLLYFKSEILKQAVSLHGESLFVDADTVFLAPVAIPRKKGHDLVLSPRLGSSKATHMGSYNGGMVFASRVDIAEKWQELYVGNVGFLDEGCLDDLAKEFKFLTFGDEWNHGPWRAKPPQMEPSSFHVHLDPQRIAALPDEVYRKQTEELAGLAVGCLGRRGLYPDWASPQVLSFQAPVVQAPVQQAPGQLAPVPVQQGPPVLNLPLPVFTPALPRRVEMLPTLVPSLGPEPGYVVPYFAAPGSNSSLANYADQMFAPGGALEGRLQRSLVVEVAFGDRPFRQWPAGVNALQLRSDSLLWQKEAMVNLGCQFLANRGYTNLGYLDCDTGYARGVRWETPRLWEMLRAGPVQLGEFINHEFEDGEVSAPLAASDYAKHGGDPRRCGHAGLGWAFTRDWWAGSGGLYDNAIVGGGELFNWAGMTCSGGADREKLLDIGCLAGLHNLQSFREDFADWALSAVYQTGSAKPGYLKGIGALAKPHGKQADRMYDSRYHYLDRAGFNPRTMLDYDENGLLRWTEEAPGVLRQGCATLFHLREGKAAKASGQNGGASPNPVSSLPAQPASLMWGVAQRGNPNSWVAVG